MFIVTLQRQKYCDLILHPCELPTIYILHLLKGIFTINKPDNQIKSFLIKKDEYVTPRQTVFVDVKQYNVSNIKSHINIKAILLVIRFILYLLYYVHRLKK